MGGSKCLVTRFQSRSRSCISSLQPYHYSGSFLLISMKDLTYETRQVFSSAIAAPDGPSLIPHAYSTWPPHASPHRLSMPNGKISFSVIILQAFSLRKQIILYMKIRSLLGESSPALMRSGGANLILKIPTLMVWLFFRGFKLKQDFQFVHKRFPITPCHKKLNPQSSGMSVAFSQPSLTPRAPNFCF